MTLHKSALALAISSILVSTSALADSPDVHVEESLGVTMQTIGNDADVSDLMNRITLPEPAADRATEARGDNHRADADNRDDHADERRDRDNHGKAISELATQLGETRRSGDDEAFDRSREALTALATEHARENATEAAHDATERATETAEHAASDARDSAADEAEHAAEAASNTAVEEAAHAAEAASDAAAEEAAHAAEAASEAAAEEAAHAAEEAAQEALDAAADDD
jgi:hypothetical protein